MILFSKENAKKIVDIEKFETRRFWKTKRMSPGKTYYAQTSLKPKDRFARLLCLDCWEWDGKTISEESAIAEGYESPEAFLDAYYEMNKHNIEDPYEAAERTHYAIKFQILEHYKEDTVIIYNYQTLGIDKKTGLPIMRMIDKRGF